MAVERLVQEISRLTPQDRAELLRRLGLAPADTTKVADNAAPFERIGFGMWAGKDWPPSAKVGAGFPGEGMET